MTEPLGDPITFVIMLMTVYAYALATLGRRAQRIGGERPRLFFVLLVPCLNEAGVIARTLASLLELSGRILVIVIDDDSDDGSVSVIRQFLADRRVRLLLRPPSEARTGKGDALNAGYAEIRRLRLAERYGADNVVVTVFDADARVDAGFLEVVAPYFSDPATAGVQSAVRMYNASRNLLTFWQNLEFVIWGELFSRGKDRLGSATLGGNGQSVRLSALLALGARPWRASLTEDLDLSLRLLLRGYRLRFCPHAAVYQEALPRFRSLVRQRARWMQGHLVTWQYVPALLRSPLPLRARADLVTFLVIPALFLPIGLATVGSWMTFLGNAGRWSLDALMGWYLLGFPLAPLIMLTRRRAERLPTARAIVDAHAFFAYSVIWMAAAVGAVWNVMLGRRAWAKTSRGALAEPSDQLEGAPSASTSRAPHTTSLVDDFSARRAVQRQRRAPPAIHGMFVAAVLLLVALVSAAAFRADRQPTQDRRDSPATGAETAGTVLGEAGGGKAPRGLIALVHEDFDLLAMLAHPGEGWVPASTSRQFAIAAVPTSVQRSLRLRAVGVADPPRACRAVAATRAAGVVIETVVLVETLGETPEWIAVVGDDDQPIAWLGLDRDGRLAYPEGQRVGSGPILRPHVWYRVSLTVDLLAGTYDWELQERQGTHPAISVKDSALVRGAANVTRVCFAAPPSLDASDIGSSLYIDSLRVQMAAPGP